MRYALSVKRYETPYPPATHQCPCLRGSSSALKMKAELEQQQDRIGSLLFDIGLSETVRGSAKAETDLMPSMRNPKARQMKTGKR
jgi:hypothetical protein